MPERRRFARIPVCLQVKFKSLAQLEKMMDASIGDISQGGMFIKTDHIKPPGTKVAIELPVREDLVVNISGTVRSIRHQDEKPIGMGIEFENLDDNARKLIDYLLARASHKAAQEG